MDQVKDDVVSWELAEEMLNTIEYLKTKLELYENLMTKREKEIVNSMMAKVYKRGYFGDINNEKHNG